MSKKELAQLKSKSRSYSKAPLLIFGTSGAGKTNMIRYLHNQYGKYFEFCISYTTRPPRKDEKPGILYNFITREEFEEKVKNGDFIEHQEKFGNLYGTPKRHFK